MSGRPDHKTDLIGASDWIAAEFSAIPFEDHEARILAFGYLQLRGRRTTYEDWAQAIKLAYLWSGYWEDEPVVRMDTGRVGFLARAFLAAMHELRIIDRAALPKGVDERSSPESSSDAPGAVIRLAPAPSESAENER